MTSLATQFAQAETPDPAELRGPFEVRLVTGILPDIRFFGHKKFFPDNVQTQGGGYNEFLGRIRLGNFIIEPRESILGDGQNVLAIDYNRPGNPFFVRPLTDEIKKVGPGKYLGRGIFTLFGKSFNSFYFTVTRPGA